MTSKTSWFGPRSPPQSLCSDAKKGPCGSSCNSCPDREDCDIEHLIPDPGCCTANNVDAPPAPANNVCSSSHEKYTSDPVFNKTFKVRLDEQRRQRVRGA